MNLEKGQKLYAVVADYSDSTPTVRVATIERVTPFYVWTNKYLIGFTTRHERKEIGTENERIQLTPLDAWRVYRDQQFAKVNCLHAALSAAKMRLETARAEVARLESE